MIYILENYGVRPVFRGSDSPGPSGRLGLRTIGYPDYRAPGISDVNRKLHHRGVEKQM